MPRAQLTPCSNKLLQKIWDDKNYKMHREKVLAAKPVIDNKPPRVDINKFVKLNDLQIEADRLAQVAHDNQLLLEKISLIMRTKGDVDNVNNYKQKSLNSGFRTRELLRITHENWGILERLEATKGQYSVKKWLQDYKMNQKYLANIRQY